MNTRICQDELEMQRIEAEGDRLQTERDERAKWEARRRMESGVSFLDEVTKPGLAEEDAQAMLDAEGYAAHAHTPDVVITVRGGILNISLSKVETGEISEFGTIGARYNLWTGAFSIRETPANRRKVFALLTRLYPGARGIGPKGPFKL